MPPSGDTEAYFAMARFLATGKGPAILSHPPMYPIFLMFTDVLSGGPLWITWVAQALLGALIVPMTYGLGRRIHSDLAGLCAAAWCAVDPFQITMTQVLLSETLFTALLIVGLWTLATAYERQSTALFAWAGALLSLAALTRSVLLPLAGYFIVMALLEPKTAPAYRCVRAVAFTVAFSVPMAGWSLVVRHMTGHWLVASVQKGWNSYEGLNPDFDDPGAIARWQAGMFHEMYDHHLQDPVELDNYFWQKTKTVVGLHPFRTVKLMARKFFKFWRIWPYFPYGLGQRIISGAFMIPLLLLMMWGCWGEWSRRSTAPWMSGVLMGFVLFYALLNTMTWTQIRYRIPIHPVLEIYAAMGLARWLRPRGDSC